MDEPRTGEEIILPARDLQIAPAPEPPTFECAPIATAVFPVPISEELIATQEESYQAVETFLREKNCRIGTTIMVRRIKPYIPPSLHGRWLRLHDLVPVTITPELLTEYKLTDRSKRNFQP